jgi:heterodisulfide reductase subunit B
VTVQSYLYFPGCKIDRFLPQYSRATRAVSVALGIELEQTELNCCGYPVRHENFLASMTAAARNLALAAAQEMALMTPCKCCYGNLKHADYWLRQRADLRQSVNALLKKEGLAWRPDIRIRHLLTVLFEDVGLDVLKDHVCRPLDGLKVAAHYGCHALRPGNITQFDNPLAPTIFEQLVSVTGATAVDWPLRLECCGHPLWEKDNRFSLALMHNKLNDARTAGAQVMATACTYCQMQFDAAQQAHPSKENPLLPAVLYPQLLGIAMGLPQNELGLSENRIAWILR